MVIGLVTENLEAYTERRQSVAEQAEGTRFIRVESAIINYGVALLLDRVRDWLDIHAPRVVSP
jgi:hypothetical protein